MPFRRPDPGSPWTLWRKSDPPLYSPRSSSAPHGIAPHCESKLPTPALPQGSLARLPPADLLAPNAPRSPRQEPPRPDGRLRSGWLPAESAVPSVLPLLATVLPQALSCLGTETIALLHRTVAPRAPLRVSSPEPRPISRTASAKQAASSVISRCLPAIAR